MIIKIPSVIDLRLGNNKAIINELIETCGKSKDINQLALTVHCVTDSGHPFEIVQFHNRRHTVDILSGQA